jgi:hypothetical protein
VRDENQQVDHYLVTGTFDLEVLEEHVETETFVGLLDDVFPVEILGAQTARTVDFAAERDEWEPAGDAALEV